MVIMTLKTEVVFRCLFCPCVFSSQVDLDLHLKAFGAVPHLCLWRGVHFLINHGSVRWHRRYKRYICPSVFQHCVDFLCVH
jgi:hypothetical protein